ncbi:hypothetical protein [Nonomuraea sp. NPDC050786]|uniref:hypothetical protein n=1 Tax=Nonomuraea sp. NPDC050786 TaxID=3154840 RepID=UPI0033C271A7
MASRREHDRLRDDAWTVLFTSQNTVIQVMLQAAQSGWRLLRPAQVRELGSTP